MTVEPNKDIINYFIEDFNDSLLKGKSTNLAILGPQQVNIDIAKLPIGIKIFESIHAFRNKFLKASIYV